MIDGIAEDLVDEDLLAGKKDYVYRAEVAPPRKR